MNSSCAYQSLFIYLYAYGQNNEKPEQSRVGITKWFDHHVSTRADYFHKGCGHFALKEIIISTSKLEHRLNVDSEQKIFSGFFPYNNTRGPACD